MKPYDLTLFKRAGRNVIIDPFVDIRRPDLIEIGDNVSIDFGVVISTAAKIGSYCHIAPHTTIIGGSSSMFIMGDCSSFSANCHVIVAGDEHVSGHGLVGPDRIIPESFRDKKVGGTLTLQMFVNLATGVTIQPSADPHGRILMEGTFAHSHSVIAADTQPWTLYRGIPAKAYGERPSARLCEIGRGLGFRPLFG